MRFFNNAGPCDAERNYMLPPELRLPGVRNLVDRGHYFVVHAPRQTGKTTTLTALAREVTADGRHAALLFSCERARTYASDIGAGGARVPRRPVFALGPAHASAGTPARCRRVPAPSAGGRPPSLRTR